MAIDPKSTVLIEDARIIFRNFTGKETKFNRAGERNFGVLLNPELAEQMERDGWPVKFLKPREEGDVEQAWLAVKVAYGDGRRPPKVIMITSRGRVALEEEDLHMLDWAEFRTVDLVFRPYNWVVNGKEGIKPYLKEIFITIEESALDQKYGDVPEVRARGGAVEE